MKDPEKVMGLSRAGAPVLETWREAESSLRSTSLEMDSAQESSMWFGDALSGMARERYAPVPLAAEKERVAEKELFQLWELTVKHLDPAVRWIPRSLARVPTVLECRS